MCSDVMNEDNFIISLLLTCFMTLLICHPAVHKTEELMAQIENQNGEILRLEELSQENSERLQDLMNKHEEKLLSLEESNTKRHIQLVDKIKSITSEMKNLNGVISDYDKRFGEFQKRLNTNEDKISVLESSLDIFVSTQGSLIKKVDDINNNVGMVQRKMSEIEIRIERHSVKLEQLAIIQKKFQDLLDREKQFCSDKTAHLENAIKSSMESILFGQEKLWNSVRRMENNFSEKLRSRNDGYIVDMVKTALSDLVDFATNYVLGPLYRFLTRNDYHLN